MANKTEKTPKAEDTRVRVGANIDPDVWDAAQVKAFNTQRLTKTQDIVSAALEAYTAK